MPFSLRQASCADLPDVYSFELSYIREIEPEMEPRWIAAIPRHLRQWTDNIPRIFVAMDERGHVVGDAFWEPDAARRTPPSSGQSK